MMKHLSWNIVYLFVVVGMVNVAFCKVCNIADYGAVGDGIYKNTKEISMAISDCKSENLLDYNQILIPSGGTYLSGSIVFTSNMGLHLEEGAVLLGSEEEADYPLIAVLPSYGVGRDVPTDLRYQALIFAQNVTNFSITGGGSVNGNGDVWWKKHYAGQLEWSRPPLVEIMYGNGIHVEGVTFRDSAFWSIHPYACSNVVVRNVQIFAPGYAPNTDGVDIDSCNNVLVENCFFSLGDDGIAIKSGLNEAGREFNMPSENIIIRNITVIPQFD